MSTQDHSPWVSRFNPLLDSAELRREATVTVAPLTDLHALPLETASLKLKVALRTVFHPTTQCLDILQRMLGTAHAHCQVRYPDTQSYMRGIYSEKAPLPDFSPPICLTGLPGTGKTELLKSFFRMLDKRNEVSLDPYHPPFRLNGPWLATVQAKNTSISVLSALAGEEGKTDLLVNKCRKLAFRDGIPFLLTDELQFTTGSDSANTRVTQLLLSLGLIGIPCIFAANFTLLWRLKHRPGEEQERLLSEPIILLPDLADSQDWSDTLNAQRNVASDYLLFDPVTDARTLHVYSGGRKRAMSMLILIAFRAEYRRGGRVDCQALHRAYHSTEYSVFREENEIIMRQTIQNRPDTKRKDLWCPLPLPAGASQQFLASNLAVQEAQIGHAELMNSLTAAEHQTIAAASEQRKSKPSGKVLSLKKPKNANADELRRNVGLFRDKLE